MFKVDGQPVDGGVIAVKTLAEAIELAVCQEHNFAQITDLSSGKIIPEEEINAIRLAADGKDLQWTDVNGKKTVLRLFAGQIEDELDYLRQYVWNLYCQGQGNNQLSFLNVLVDGQPVE